MKVFKSIIDKMVLACEFFVGRVGCQGVCTHRVGKKG